jgi:hypothetical protein
MQVARILSSCLAIGNWAAIAATAFAADPQVIVDVASGRQFRGALDVASNSDQLVLRMEQAGLTLRRPIRWERVIAATADGKPIEVAALRKLAISQQTAPTSKPTLLNKIEMRSDTPPNTAPPEQQPLPEESPRVAMVVFDASIANWDADVETDGVVIDVVPLDINRRLVPISGTLEVELYAQQRRTLDLAPQSGGSTLEVVERWTRAITPEDFGPSGVRLRLPFGAITPELQPNWTAWHYGLVHVRLAVPGHGVFEDSRDGIRVRPWAPNRDRLEMKTGQRFLSTENLGRRD